jgi:4-deoxy-L-threo-5-hexosulose-uronate ketol-isomerase
MSTEQLRERFVVSDLFVAGAIRTLYSHEDRLVIGGAVPTFGNPLPLPTFDPLRSETFCERRELGIVAIGGPGSVEVDGVGFAMAHYDVLYVGMGARDITFGAAAPDEGAAFYLVSSIAHVNHPTRLVRVADAETTAAGSSVGANQRVITKYIHAGGAQSAQLVLGITALQPGNVWNTMPCHLHDRRTEIYLYLGLPADARLIHLMGEPDRTRSLILADRDAVISPSWSVHFGAGTQNYSFVWAMAGENQSFSDMDQVPVTELR